MTWLNDIQTPMTPAEREAHEQARAARGTKPTTGDLIMIAATFAALGVIAYASHAGWLS